MPASETACYQIEATINGRSQRLTVDPRTSLLDLLREHLDLGASVMRSDAAAEPPRLSPIGGSWQRGGDRA